MQKNPLNISNPFEFEVYKVLYSMMDKPYLLNWSNKPYWKYMQEKIKDNTIVYQPPINCKENVKNKHMDFALYLNGKKYIIECKYSNKSICYTYTNSVLQLDFFFKFAREKNKILVIGGNGFLNNVSKFDLEKKKIKVLTLDTIKELK